MTDKELKTRIKSIVDDSSFSIGDLTLMYEHKQIDSDDFYKEIDCMKSYLVKSIVKLIKEHEQLLEEKEC
nr:MAG TPA: hypothetical protein [Caudoviricetes sp.]